MRRTRSVIGRLRNTISAQTARVNGSLLGISGLLAPESRGIIGSWID
jgi:hypothetical protein